MTAPVNPNSETYETLMQVAWNFDYQGEVAKLDDLYNRAKENQWNAADLEWDTPIDPSNPIMAPEHSQYARMPFFQKLSAQQQETFAAHDHAVGAIEIDLELPVHAVDLEIRRDTLQQFSDIDTFNFFQGASFFEASELQQTLDQILHAQGLGTNILVKLVALLGRHFLV